MGFGAPNQKSCIVSLSHQIESLVFLAKVRNEFGAGLRVTVHAGNTAPFQEMLQLWPAVGNTESNLTESSFEPRTYHSGDKRVTLLTNLTGSIQNKAMILFEQTDPTFLVVVYSPHVIVIVYKRHEIKLNCNYVFIY